MTGIANHRLVVSRLLTKQRWGRLEVASMEDLVGEARDNFVSVVRAGAERREWRQRARLVQEEERRARKERERGRRRTNERRGVGRDLPNISHPPVPHRHWLPGPRQIWTWEHRHPPGSLSPFTLPSPPSADPDTLRALSPRPRLPFSSSARPVRQRLAHSVSSDSPPFSSQPARQVLPYCRGCLPKTNQPQCLLMVTSVIDHVLVIPEMPSSFLFGSVASSTVAPNHRTRPAPMCSTNLHLLFSRPFFFSPSVSLPFFYRAHPFYQDGPPNPLTSTMVGLSRHA